MQQCLRPRKYIGLGFWFVDAEPLVLHPVSGTIQCKSARVYLQMYNGGQSVRERERERERERKRDGFKKTHCWEGSPPKFSPWKRLCLTPVSFDLLARRHVTVKWPIILNAPDRYARFIRSTNLQKAVQSYRKLYWKARYASSRGTMVRTQWPAKYLEWPHHGRSCVKHFEILLEL